MDCLEKGCLHYSTNLLPGTILQYMYVWSLGDLFCVRVCAAGLHSVSAIFSIKKQEKKQ
jgi:hypothetical protein